MSQKLSRRELLKLAAAATGATVLSSVPTKWVTPLVEIGAIPAHAQGSQPPGAISGNIVVLGAAFRPTQGSPSVGNIPQLLAGTIFPAVIPGVVANGVLTNSGNYNTSYLISPVPPGNNYKVGAALNGTGCSYSGDVTPVVVTSGNTTTGVNFTFDCRK